MKQFALKQQSELLKIKRETYIIDAEPSLFRKKKSRASCWAYYSKNTISSNSYSIWYLELR